MTITKLLRIRRSALTETDKNKESNLEFLINISLRFDFRKQVEHVINLLLCNNEITTKVKIFNSK